jgi:xanthine dehydrogenase accessory factor
MRRIFGDLDQWQREHEQIALATLVSVHGSAPQLPGARLCVTRSGKMAGSVSGGCVEADVYQRALQVLDSGQPVLARYGITDDLGGVGLTCGGVIDVLIEPFGAGEAWQALRQAIEAQRPAVLALGLTPAAIAGRKLVVLGETTAVGSIDPSLDQQVAGQARELVSAEGTRVLTLPWGDQEATVFVEAFPAPLRLFIVGATHTAMPLCRMAKVLGFRVTVIDARGTFATRERFPDAEEVRRAWPHEVLAEVALDAHSHVVILTHDFKFDLPALAQALRSEACYIGVMGSRRTHAQRMEELRDQGFGAADLARIRAPIGLDIGACSPEEIAVAILAEMLAVRHGRDGRSLAAGGVASHAGS